mmetsp:Transcript_27493/g.58812  ORF Transcript_27493/g.58812 Transcript_27493/m.58812 type:complete len:317 (+) Transcript_27493:1791-2741(+)
MENVQVRGKEAVLGHSGQHLLVPGDRRHKRQLVLEGLRKESEGTQGVHRVGGQLDVQVLLLLLLMFLEDDVGVCAGVDLSHWRVVEDLRDVPESFRRGPGSFVVLRTEHGVVAVQGRSGRVVRRVEARDVHYHLLLSVVAFLAAAAGQMVSDERQGIVHRKDNVRLQRRIRSGGIGIVVVVPGPVVTKDREPAVVSHITVVVSHKHPIGRKTRWKRPVVAKRQQRTGRCCSCGLLPSAGGLFGGWFAGKPRRRVARNNATSTRSALGVFAGGGVCRRVVDVHQRNESCLHRGVAREEGFQVPIQNQRINIGACFAR